MMKLTGTPQCSLDILRTFPQTKKYLVVVSSQEKEEESVRVPERSRKTGEVQTVFINELQPLDKSAWRFKKAFFSSFADNSLRLLHAGIFHKFGRAR